MSSGIYKITNIATGDFYIGQSINIEKRKIYHLWELHKNRHSNEYLQRAYNKYGKENFVFEIILYCEPFELTRYEQALVDRWNPSYNMHVLCVDSAKGVKRSEETKKKMSAWQVGKYMSDETRAKISKSLTGTHLSDETKRKISEKFKGIVKGPITEEHRKHLSESHRGLSVSEETRIKKSAAMKLSWRNKKLGLDKIVNRVYNIGVIKTLDEGAELEETNEDNINE